MSYPPTSPTYTITEELDYPVNIWRWATTDPVKGASGAGATDDVDNYPITQLANRTKYLKDKIDTLIAQTPVFASVSMTNEQDIAIGDGSINKILFDTVDFDAHALWSVSNKRFVAPSAGIFSVMCNLTGIDVTEPNISEPYQLVVWVKKNGTIIRSGHASPGGRVGLGVSGSLQCIVPAATSEYIEIFASIAGTLLPGTCRIGMTDVTPYRNESCYAQVTFIPTA